MFSFWFKGWIFVIINIFSCIVGCAVALTDCSRETSVIVGDSLAQSGIYLFFFPPPFPLLMLPTDFLGRIEVHLLFYIHSTQRVPIFIYDDHG